MSLSVAFEIIQASDTVM